MLQRALRCIWLMMGFVGLAASAAGGDVVNIGQVATDLAERFDAWAWPTAIVVDRKGVIRYRHIGEGAYQDTEAVLRKLLSEDG
jgi:hypothetical protein